MKLRCILFFITLGISWQTFAQNADSLRQVDLVEVIIKKFKIKLPDSTRKKGKVHFSLFPTNGGLTGTNTLVTTFNAAFYLGDRTTTNVSTVYFVPYTNLSSRFGFMMRHNLWLKNNSWNFTGDYRILDYPQKAWRLGGNSPDQPSAIINRNHFQFYQTVLKGIGKNWVAGLGYTLDYHYNISESANGAEELLKEYPTGSSTSTVSSGPALSILHDSRHNSINPQDGVYFLVNYRDHTKYLGSTNEWQSFYVEGRKYVSFSDSQQNLLAFRTFYWTILTGRAPYLDLPAIGWDQAYAISGRGTPQSRYRSNALLYFESEYRVDLTANGLFGAVLFTNVFAPSQFDTQQFSYWHAAVGTGLRIKLNKYSRTNIALDVAFSKGYGSFYINIGEAF